MCSIVRWCNWQLDRLPYVTCNVKPVLKQIWSNHGNDYCFKDSFRNTMAKRGVWGSSVSRSHRIRTQAQSAWHTNCSSQLKSYFPLRPSKNKILQYMKFAFVRRAYQSMDVPSPRLHKWYLDIKTDRLKRSSDWAIEWLEFGMGWGISGGLGGGLVWPNVFLRFCGHLLMLWKNTYFRHECFFPKSEIISDCDSDKNDLNWPYVGDTHTQTHTYTSLKTRCLALQRTPSLSPAHSHTLQRSYFSPSMYIAIIKLHAQIFFC